MNRRNPLNTCQARLFTCLLALLVGCAPGSEVSLRPSPIETMVFTLTPTLTPTLTSTVTPTLTSTVTPAPSLTLTPVPILTSTPTPRPIVECVNCQIIYTASVKGIFQMFKMGEDGSNPVNITPPDLGQVLDFALSPDGTRIAFVANQSRDSYLSEYFDEMYHEIYVMNADGSHVVNLTQNQVYDGFPAWSPDGTRIAFISRSEDIRDKGRYLYMMNADGSNRTLVREGLVDTPPAWSPESSKIAFLGRMSGDDAFLTLNVINADGSYFGGGFPVGWELGRDRPFDWSPNGSQIIFQLSKFESGGIILLNAVEGGTQPISNIGKSPTWSPDGKQIAFVSRSSTDKDEVSVMNADGSNVTLLTQNSNWDDVFQLTWSPGGSKLVFVARQGANEQIYRVSADGSNLTPLSKDRGVVFRQIAWAP